MGNTIESYIPNKEDTFYILDSELDKGGLFPDKLFLYISLKNHPELKDFILDTNENFKMTLKERFGDDIPLDIIKDTNIQITFDSRYVDDNSKPFAVVMRPVMTENSDGKIISTAFDKSFRNINNNESKIILNKINSFIGEKGIPFLRDAIIKRDVPKGTSNWKRMRVSLREVLSMFEKSVSAENNFKEQTLKEAEKMEYNANGIKVDKNITMRITPSFGRLKGNSYSFSIPLEEKGKFKTLFIPKEKVTLGDKNDNYYKFELIPNKNYVLYPKDKNPYKTGLQIAEMYERAIKKYKEKSKEIRENIKENIPKQEENKQRPVLDNDFINGKEQPIPPEVIDKNIGKSFFNINIDGEKGIKNIPNDIHILAEFCSKHMNNTIEISDEKGKALFLWESGMVTNKGATVKFIENFMKEVTPKIIDDIDAEAER